MHEPTKTGNVINRRNFLRNTGLTGMGLASATVLAGELGALDHVPGASALGLGSKGVAAASLSANDIAVLQFALNLEYLEAEFYSYSVTGRSLEANGIPTNGKVGTYGPTTGGEQVPFSALGAVGPVQAVSEQLMRDEFNHVLLLRSVLGAEYTIAKPTIDLNAAGKYADRNVYLMLARDFEALGTSAYGGAVTLLTENILQPAAQIAIVEALHTGNLQLLCELNHVQVAPLDSMDMVPPPHGGNYFLDSLNQGLAIIRTPQEVLSVAYMTKTTGSTTGGGFFPNGVNGQITTA